MNKKASEGIIKLSQNENPVGPSPLALKAIKEHGFLINRYPEPHSSTLKVELANELALSPDNIFVSAGSIELLDIFIRNFIGENENIIIPKLTFVAYKIIAEVFGVTIIFSGMKDYRIDIDSILENYNNQTKMIIIANPNNPTGTIISEKEMIKLLENVSPQTFVVIDEAYCEYVSDSDYPNTFELQKQYPNLITLRTFSKIYGLAGLRVGYAIAAQDIIERLDHYQPPFTVNQMAAVAASASLKDKKFLKDSIETNKKTRTRLEKELTGLGYNVIPSEGNFIFIHFDRIEERDLIFEQLKDQNVLTRKMDFFGDSKALRITVPKPDNCQYVIDCLYK
jgi:histidinol-phosphate aminotransferase